MTDGAIVVNICELGIILLPRSICLGNDDDFGIWISTPDTLAHPIGLPVSNASQGNFRLEYFQSS